MAINAVSPWEGVLHWVGQPKEGSTRTGGEWKSVEFVLKYEDRNMNEKFMLFSAFGLGLVEKLLSFPTGTALKVVWFPESTYYEKTERWYMKNSVISIGLAKQEAESARTDIKAPDFPQDADLPF